MNYKVVEFNKIREFLGETEIISEDSFLFLPENLFETNEHEKFIYSETATDLKKVFKSMQVPILYFSKDKPLFRSRKSSDWFGPTIFIGFSLIANNPQIIGISMNLISSYLYDFLKGTISSKKVKFEIIVERKKGKEYKKISYDGNIEGIKELEKVINSLD